MKKIAVILIAISCSCLQGQAQEARFPAPAGFVNDHANVLSRDARARIEALATRVEDKTSAEIAVATVRTTVPLTIEQYAVELFRKWGIGKKGKDNGILILVATEDRAVRIEVGYGLEGAVTDLESKLIIQDHMIPQFKKGDYDLGVLAGTTLVAGLIGKEYGVELDIESEMRDIPLRRQARASPFGGLLTLLFFMLIFGVRFGTFFFLMSGGSYWSSGGGGSFGGGFGGFGGGMSGGGGASGSW